MYGGDDYADGILASGLRDAALRPVLRFYNTIYFAAG